MREGKHVDVTRLSSNEKLHSAGIAYILQDKSVFPGMTVEENLWLGAYLMDRKAAKQAADRIFDRYPRLAARRKHQARVLSGGERRLLEISRALVMDPQVLLVDEPSIGLEPRFIDMVFEILGELQHNEGKTIVMVEQNAKKGLEYRRYRLRAGVRQAGLGGAGKRTFGQSGCWTTISRRLATQNFGYSQIRTFGSDLSA